MQQIVLKAGIAGKAKIVLKGKGGLLDTPGLPISTLPVAVQLVSSDGRCWATSYSSTLANRTDLFKAKSD